LFPDYTVYVFVLNKADFFVRLFTLRGYVCKLRKFEAGGVDGKGDVKALKHDTPGRLLARLHGSKLLPKQRFGNIGLRMGGSVLCSDLDPGAGPCAFHYEFVEETAKECDLIVDTCFSRQNHVLAIRRALTVYEEDAEFRAKYLRCTFNDKFVLRNFKKTEAKSFVPKVRQKKRR
jgi:hypothetical protein